MKKGVSLSTLRRYIKANKIPYRIENGRYLLPDNVAANIEPEARRAPVGVAVPSARPQAQPERRDDAASTQVIQKLKLELQKAREEIAELKTLIAFYEERTPGSRFDV